MERIKIRKTMLAIEIAEDAFDGFKVAVRKSRAKHPRSEDKALEETLQLEADNVLRGYERVMVELKDRYDHP